VRLHQRRWESKGYPGSFENIHFREFHKQIMPRMLKNGHLQLWFLSDGTTSYGVIYNILYKNKIYFYQSGISTEQKECAWGYLLHSHCIEQAIRFGMKEYDFLPKGSNDDYKERFAKERRQVVDLFLGNSVLGKSCEKARQSAALAWHLLRGN
jgi:CelD/BcsL family acetyltransferase involved in cellulose biosynthesis